CTTGSPSCVRPPAPNSPSLELAHVHFARALSNGFQQQYLRRPPRVKTAPLLASLMLLPFATLCSSCESFVTSFPGNRNAAFNARRCHRQTRAWLSLLTMSSVRNGPALRVRHIWHKTPEVAGRFTRQAAAPSLTIETTGQATTGRTADMADIAQTPDPPKTGARRQRTVGFVGLGNMGWPMASNLHNAGFDLVVRDIAAATQERFAAAHAGVTPAWSPAAFGAAG